jgi:predicted DCC family thiol-disulfide oxidoreductase YuxK
VAPSTSITGGRHNVVEGFRPLQASWHLVAPNGRTYSGGKAVPQLARLLPAGAPIAALASAFPRATDRAYRWVARHRERLGRVLGERACAVDPAEWDR